MPKAFKHTGVLMMLAVVALGLVGAGYALWYEELAVTATVNTGTLNADWSIHGTAQPVVCLTGAPGEAGCATFANFSGKLSPEDSSHLANIRYNSKFPACTQAIGPAVHGAGTPGSPSDGDNNGTPTNNLLSLTIGGSVGAYPYAGCIFTIDISNAGTVPFHLAFEGQAALPNTIGVIGQPSTGTDGSGNFAGNGNANPTNHKIALCNSIAAGLGGGTVPAQNADLGINGDGGPQATQIHQGEQIICDILVYLKQDPAAEGKQFNVSWEIIAHQWNENVNSTNHPASFEAGGN